MGWMTDGQLAMLYRDAKNKKEQLEIENEQLRERSKELQMQCKVLLTQNQQLQDINTALAVRNRGLYNHALTSVIILYQNIIGIIRFVRISSKVTPNGC